MHTKIILSFILSLFLATKTFAQLDPDYLDNKKKGDDCFAKKDYDCAEKHYNIAKGIKENDTYCLERIEACKEAKELVSKKKKTVVEKPKKITVREMAEKDLYSTTINDKWGFLYTTTGEFSKGSIAVPFVYENAGEFGEGLAPVKKNGKCGFINKFNKFIIPSEYEWAFTFKEGLACVEKNGKWGFINKSNQAIIPFEYVTFSEFTEGLAKVKKNGKTFYINKQNQCVKDCP
jgi:hypothetical protein